LFAHFKKMIYTVKMDGFEQIKGIGFLIACPKIPGDCFT